MSDQQQNPKPNIIDFIQATKDRYYGSTYRELPGKVQLHLKAVVWHIDEIQKKELEQEIGPDTY